MIRKTESCVWNLQNFFDSIYQIRESVFRKVSNGDCRSDFENHIDDQVNDDEEDSSVNNLWGQMILTNNIMMMTVIIMMTVITLKWCESQPVMMIIIFLTVLGLACDDIGDDNDDDNDDDSSSGQYLGRPAGHGRQAPNSLLVAVTHNLIIIVIIVIARFHDNHFHQRTLSSSGRIIRFFCFLSFHKTSKNVVFLLSGIEGGPLQKQQ